MERFHTNQTKHDKEVERIANSYRSMGHLVHADIFGWSKPQIINGYIPDVMIFASNKTMVFEVETLDSVNSLRDIEQQRAFRNWESNGPNREFQRIVV